MRITEWDHRGLPTGHDDRDMVEPTAESNRHSHRQSQKTEPRGKTKLLTKIVDAVTREALGEVS